nr:MAG TPA: hypothetical protein [Bacteriophage sp.]
MKIKIFSIIFVLQIYSFCHYSICFLIEKSAYRCVK